MINDCPECAIRREQIKNDNLEKAKQQAINYAEIKGLEKIVLYERKNGSYSYCEFGQQKASYEYFKCYSSTKDISCHLFWSTLIDGVLTRLIYEGELTEEQKQSESVKVQLIAAWNDILIEHAESINDDAIYSSQQVLEVERKTALIEWAAATCLYLRKEYHKELTDCFRNKFRTSGVQLNISDPFQFQRDLDRCIAVSKSWKFELTKQQEVISERVNAGNKKGELTYKTFAKTLVAMSKFMGYKLNAKELTVYDYDMIYSDMVEQAAKEK